MVTINELQNSYDEFVQILTDEILSTSNYLSCYSNFIYTQLELNSLKISNRNCVIKNELHEKFLMKALEFIKAELSLLKILIQKSDSPVLQNKILSSKKLKWTGTYIELIELIYGLQVVKKINNGNVGTSELVDYFSNIFDLSIKDCYGTYINITRRNGESRTYLLDMMALKLNEKMNNADEK